MRRFYVGDVIREIGSAGPEYTIIKKEIVCDSETLTLTLLGGVEVSARVKFTIGRPDRWVLVKRFVSVNDVIVRGAIKYVVEGVNESIKSVRCKDESPSSSNIGDFVLTMEQLEDYLISRLWSLQGT